MPIEKLAIIGAGMAGLTAALSFARHGIACDIFEEAPAIAEVGAGLQISPNAARVLAKLGVLSALEAVWTEPERIALASGTSLRPLAHVPAGSFARNRWGAPYGVLHRATLQKALLDAVMANPLCTVHLDSPIRLQGGENLTDESGAAYPLIIGADGVWSNLRPTIPGSPEPDFSGSVCWRVTIPRNAAPDWLSANQVTAFLGPSTHMVSYPLREIDGINIVAIASGISPGETWNAEASESQRRMLLGQFRRWDRRIVSVLEKAERPTFWPLYQVTTGRWHNGTNRVLIGDAAHAMTPFSAQGAAAAIEDAFILSNRVAMMTSLPEALSAYEKERSARVARVKARGVFNRFAYHARGPIRLGRDLVLSLRPPQSLAADFDWLYGFNAE
ncbi:FAD-dependent monooxygenase [Neorhizobium alkalisoli]|uniref:Salicylate hydroxylase n=1 Tax=Neorhizobium alkalisoli TaxID=528178 RepID=A0A561QHQ3_9HYPH|nr:FAD-dependent monooxygenase [Neorhizobium alkalisoli]TWF49869.1 salicylate hydroxylase [Neorhizobium alkalisoli]